MKLLNFSKLRDVATLTTATIVTVTTVNLGNTPSALASLIGDTVTVCASFADDGCPPNNPFSSALQEQGIVGNRTEFDNGTFSIDVQDSMFVLSLTSATPDEFIFNPTLWIISDLDWVDKPGMVIGVESTAGVPQGTNTQFTANSVTITLPEITLPGSNSGGFRQEYEFNLQTKHIPEPTSTLSLLTLGTLGTAFTLKRHKKKNKKTIKIV